MESNHAPRAERSADGASLRAVCPQSHILNGFIETLAPWTDGRLLRAGTLAVVAAESKKKSAAYCGNSSAHDKCRVARHGLGHARRRFPDDGDRTNFDRLPAFVFVNDFCATAELGHDGIAGIDRRLSLYGPVAGAPIDEYLSARHVQRRRPSRGCERNSRNGRSEELEIHTQSPEYALNVIRL